MDVSITDVTDVEKEIQINLSMNELTPHFDAAYKRYQPKLEVRGFRKGKVPLDLVKKLYAEQIEYESLDTVANDVYRKIIEERNIYPIGQPVIIDLDYKRGEVFTFKVKYEVKPNIVLQEYKNIAAEKLIHKITEEEYQNEILRLRRSNSNLTPAERATDDEHVITVDLQELDETGSPLIGKKTSDHRFYLVDESIHQKIKESLRNTAVGAINRLVLEDDHESHRHTIHLEITVKKVEKVNLPVVDDAFVAKITKEKVTSSESFLANLRADIESYWQEKSEQKLMNTIITEIVRRHDIVIPESIEKGLLDSLIDEVKNRYPNKKPPADFDEQKFREDNRAYAKFQSKWLLIREKIIEKEGLQVNESDLMNLAEVDASKVGIDKDRMLSFYKTSDTIKQRIFTQKLNALLKDSAKITETITEEFFN